MLCKWLGVNTFSRPMQGAKPLRMKRCANVASCPVGQLLYVIPFYVLFSVSPFPCRISRFWWSANSARLGLLRCADVWRLPGVYLRIWDTGLISTSWETEASPFLPRHGQTDLPDFHAVGTVGTVGRDKMGQRWTKSFMAVRRTLDPWFIQLLKGLSRRFQKSIRSKQKCYCIKINQAFCNWNMCGDGSCLTCSKLASADDLSSIKHGKWGWQNHETLGLTGVPSRSK